MFSKGRTRRGRAKRARDGSPAPARGVLLARPVRTVLALVMLSTAVGGCARVRPHEREHLAHPAMQAPVWPAIDRADQHTFTVREGTGEWSCHAIEINLRKGGTTHPFLTLQFLTDGRYDAERAVFTAPSGRPKCFVASDHVESPLYRALTPDDLIDLALRRGLHFDQSRQTGVVFHMLSALPEAGRLGLTAVADTPAEAEALYRRTLEALDEEARAALLDPGLPAA